MAEKTQTIRLRRGTGNQLITSSTVLRDAEPCLISTNGDSTYDSIIIGDGVTPASELTLIPLNMTKGAVFLGIANPDTIPGTPRQSVFYYAGERGTYQGFGNITVNASELAILLWKHGAWSKLTIYTPAAPEIDEELDITSHRPVSNSTITLKLRDLEAMMIKGISINDVMLDARNGVINLTVDGELSGESTNPIQNRAVHSKLAEFDEWYEN